MNTGKRRAKDWFAPVIERDMEGLADIVARYSERLVVDGINRNCKVVWAPERRPYDITPRL